MTESHPEPSADVNGGTSPVAALAPLLLLCGTGAAILLALIVAMTSAGGADGPSQATVLLCAAVLPAALCAAGLIAFRWPTSMLGALIVACMFLNVGVERVYVPTGFFKLYLHDILLLAALFAALLRVGAPTGPRWTSSALGKWMVVTIVFAAFQTVRGLAKGNEFNAAFGDFRRGYFYMIVYFLVLAEAGDPKRLRFLHRAILLGSMLIVVRGLYRLFGGGFFQLSWFDVYHALGHDDLIFVTFLSYYCLARLVFPTGGLQRWLWGLLFPVTLMLIVLGNFRAGWLGFLLAGMVGFVLLPGSKRRPFLVAALPLMVAVAVGFYLSRNVRIGQFGETLQDEVTAKFKSMIDYETDPNIIWRFHSYQAAWRIWSEDYLLGAGLGRRLVFHSINASGQQSIQFNHRAHNAPLDVAYRTGIVGLIFFLLLHGTYFFGAIRGIRHSGERAETGVLLAYIAFYVAFMTVAMFDVPLESSWTAIVLYAHMGIVRRLGETATRNA